MPAPDATSSSLLHLVSSWLARALMWAAGTGCRAAGRAQDVALCELLRLALARSELS